jgi:MFS family permease
MPPRQTDNISAMSPTTDQDPSAHTGPSLLLRTRAIIAGMMVNLLVGTFYNYSNINSYIAVYLKKKSEDTIVAQQLWLLFHSLFAILSVRVAEKIGYWTLNFIAFAIFSAIHLFASWIHDYTAFVLFYGIAAGISIGFGYLPTLYIAWTYFPKSKSVATGVILFCTGMSASVFSPLTSWIVNPDNLSKKDPRYGERVPLLFRYLALIYGCITLVACLIQPPPYKGDILEEHVQATKIIKNKHTASNEQLISAHRTLRNHENVKVCGRVLDKEDIHLIHKDNLTKEVGTHGAEVNALLGAINVVRIHDMLLSKLRHSKGAKAHHETHADEHYCPEGHYKPFGEKCSRESRATLQRVDELQDTACPSLWTALKSRSFAILVVMAFSGMIYSYFINSNWKEFYSLALPEVKDQALSLVLSVGAIGNSTIRIITGVVLTKVKFRWVYFIPSTLSILGSFLFLTLLKSYVMGLVLIVCAMASLGINMTLFPTACTEVFGPVVGPKVYPFIFFIFAISSFSQFFLKKFYGERDPKALLYIFGAISILGFLISFLLPTNQKWNLSSRQQEKRQRKMNERSELQLHECSDIVAEADCEEGVKQTPYSYGITNHPEEAVNPDSFNVKLDTEMNQLKPA